MSRPEKSLHFLVINPVSSLQYVNKRNIQNKKSLPKTGGFCNMYYIEGKLSAFVVIRCRQANNAVSSIAVRVGYFFVVNTVRRYKIAFAV